MTNPWLRKLPGLSPRSTALLASAATASQPASVTATVIENVAVAAATAGPTRPSDQSRHGAEGAAAEAAAAPAHNATGGLSMARQLGLGVSRIVIDPGHGGHDPGAQSRGVVEAELVLDVALRLEQLLQNAPRTEVVLTRR